MNWTDEEDYIVLRCPYFGIIASIETVYQCGEPTDYLVWTITNDKVTCRKTLQEAKEFVNEQFSQLLITLNEILYESRDQ